MLWKDANHGGTEVERLRCVQATINDATHNYLHDTFSATLQRGFVASLDRIGKGWFNLAECNAHTYAQSKLARLLTAVRYMMQDAVRSLVFSSLDAFLEATRSACAASVTVHSTARVDVDRTSDSNGESTRRVPLFAVSLVADASTHAIGYADDVDSIPERVVGVAMRGVQAASGIAQLEPLVMTKLHWSYTPPLHAVHPQEPAVTDTLAEIRALVARAVSAPLATYRALFGKFEAVLARNNETAVLALLAKGPDLTLAEVQAELSAAETQLSAIQRDVPTTVCLSRFAAASSISSVMCGELLAPVCPRMLQQSLLDDTCDCSLTHCAASRLRCACTPKPSKFAWRNKRIRIDARPAHSVDALALLQVDLGAALVNTIAVRDKLLATQKDLVARLTKLLQSVPREMMVSASKRYKELQVCALLLCPCSIMSVCLAGLVWRRPAGPRRYTKFQTLSCMQASIGE